MQGTHSPSSGVTDYSFGTGGSIAKNDEAELPHMIPKTSIKLRFH